MSEHCKQMQEKMAEHRLSALRQDSSVQKHLETCNDCYYFLLSLQELDTQFAAMSTLAPPEELVNRALSKVFNLPAEEKQPSVELVTTETSPEVTSGEPPPEKTDLSSQEPKNKYKFFYKQVNKASEITKPILTRIFKFLKNLKNLKWHFPKALLVGASLIIMFLIVGTLFFTLLSKSQKSEKMSQQLQLEQSTELAAITEEESEDRNRIKKVSGKRGKGWFGPSSASSEAEYGDDEPPPPTDSPVKTPQLIISGRDLGGKDDSSIRWESTGHGGSGTVSSSSGYISDGQIGDSLDSWEDADGVIARDLVPERKPKPKSGKKSDRKKKRSKKKARKTRKTSRFNSLDSGNHKIIYGESDKTTVTRGISEKSVNQPSFAQDELDDIFLVPSGNTTRVTGGEFLPTEEIDNRKQGQEFQMGLKYEEEERKSLEVAEKQFVELEKEREELPKKELLKRTEKKKMRKMEKSQRAERESYKQQKSQKRLEPLQKKQNKLTRFDDQDEYGESLDVLVKLEGRKAETKEVLISEITEIPEIELMRVRDPDSGIIDISTEPVDGKVTISKFGNSRDKDFKSREKPGKEEDYEEDFSFATTVSSGPVYGDPSDSTGEKTISGQRISNLVAAQDAAQTFLNNRQMIEELEFKEAVGYWANTYVPGDSIIRGLRQRLTANQNNAVGPRNPSGLMLASLSESNIQPFDSPSKAALSVFMQADKRGVSGSERVLLQVGIQGTSRQGGQRSAMNMAIVLDLQEPLGEDETDNVKALLSALSDSNEVGDRFSLFVANQPGGMLIPPGSFKYGPVAIALETLLDENPEDKNTTAPVFSLSQAYYKAIDTVTADDDPTAPLGSSLVILVTSRDFGGLENHLIQIAHQSAVKGVPTSVIGVGGHVNVEKLDPVALAGQGNRRLILSPGQAKDVVKAELSAASQVVARAVRLRIRLAPGVRLVDVLGSYRLDEDRAEKVREAEKSIDIRLSKNLGIQADRGEDEDGIQIVIPAFYAGDSHVILLDVVVDRAGPLADVTLKYKDLVYLKNGISRDNQSLLRGTFASGPLEQNVIKNLLAYQLSELLKRSGGLVEDGDYTKAVALISGYIDLLRGLQMEIKGFATDPEIETDLQLAIKFLGTLDSVGGGGIDRPKDLADSLFYAGYLKLLDPR